MRNTKKLNMLLAIITTTTILISEAICTRTAVSQQTPTASVGDNLLGSKTLSKRFRNGNYSFDSKSGVQAWKKGNERRENSQSFRMKKSDDSSSSFRCKTKKHGKEVVHRYKLEANRNLKITLLGDRSMNSEDGDLSECDEFELERDFHDQYTTDDEDFRYLSVEFRSYEDGHRGWQHDVIHFGSQF